MSNRRYEVSRGCTYCNTCIFECPHGAISMTLGGARIDAALCVGCGACAENCASEAIVAIEISTGYGKEQG